MARRVAVVIAWGAAGLAFAVALTAGAFAVAGPELSRPAAVVTVDAGGASPHDRPSPRETPSPERERPKASESPDDHGGSNGSSNSGAGSGVSTHTPEPSGGSDVGGSEVGGSGSHDGSHDDD
jgi:hypothetical protein